MDVRTDRATSLVRKPLMEAALVCDKHRAKLLYVNFREHHFWRNNRYLRQVLNIWGNDRAIPLPPDPVRIDGIEFNPHAHFEDWRMRDEQAMHALDRRAREGLRDALSEIPEQRGRWRKMADLLNEREVRSFNGGKWTADNVRKQVKRGKAE